jgi:hypothetical protein
VAQAKTFKFGDTVVLLGDGATPTEAFTAPCGLTQLTLTVNFDTQQTVVPDCADPDLPAWTETDVTSLTMTIGGQGILDRDARPEWEEWFMTNTPKKVRWLYDVTLADNGGYYQAPGILTQYQVTAQRGQRAQVQVTITLQGKPTFTPAVA